MNKFELVKFCEKYSINEDNLTVESTLISDIGLDGDDVYYFIIDFEKKYNRKFDFTIFNNFFHHEFELKNPYWFFNKYKPREIISSFTILDLLKFSVPTEK